MARSSKEKLTVIELTPWFFYLETKYHGVKVETVTDKHRLAKRFLETGSATSYNDLRRICIRHYKELQNEKILKQWESQINQKKCLSKNGTAS